MKANVVTICGSTKFKDQMFDLAKRLTLSGEIVLMPLVFTHQGDQITEQQKIDLGVLHRQKIDMASTVAVVMVDYYIGESTRNEIEYAMSKQLPIAYYNFKKNEFQSVRVEGLIT